MVTGMIVDKSSDPDFDCEACIQAKHAVVPFPKSSSSQNLAVRDVVVCDIWGPASTESIHWHTYYISFTDLGSRLSLLFRSCRRPLHGLCLPSQASVRVCSSLAALEAR